MELGIYIHIPFCKRKCDYCDFVSFADKYEMQERYVSRLIEEIDDNREILKNNDITTIYIGGGTPSSIKPELIGKILTDVYKYSSNLCLDDSEITIEANPGTVNKAKLQSYKNYGINRLSIGLQSANDEILKTIGRIHNLQNFLDTYNNAIEVGFKNINVDLMIGLPNQKLSDVKESLDVLINLKPQPQHISVYSLIVEDGTLIDKKIKNGNLKLPDEDLERNQYWYVKDFLELNGYKHYEISNFAKEGFESKHNCNCWKQKQYIGFGLAAHSYIHGKRYSNTCNFDEYLNKKSNEIKEIHEIQSKFDMEQEYMLLGLRMIDGVSIKKFKEKFVDNPVYIFRNELEKLSKENLIKIDLDSIKLTNKGLDLANIVWEEFV